MLDALLNTLLATIFGWAALDVAWRRFKARHPYLLDDVLDWWDYHHRRI